MLDAPPLGEVRGAVRGDIAAGNDLGSFPEGGQSRGVSVGDAAGPDDAEPNLAAGHASTRLTFLCMVPRVMPPPVGDPTARSREIANLLVRMGRIVKE